MKNTEKRIHAIALVHKMLYRTDNLSSVNIKAYLEELFDLIMKSYETVNDKIALSTEIDDQYFLLDTAIPLGIILNELMTNSLKYAFPNYGQGKIFISLKREGVDKNILHYSDNGIGVSDNFDFRNQKSLGLKLINTIGQLQLKGKVTFKSKISFGVSCFIEFSTALYKARV